MKQEKEAEQLPDVPDYEEQKKELYHEKIRALRLMDDVFMTVVFSGDKELTEFILQIILPGKIAGIRSVVTQDTLSNLHGRSVRLDIHAFDADGKEVDIEIQRDSRGAAAKRARYNSSLMDANVLDAEKDWSKLPESYVVFLTEHDVLKGNQPIYHIDRTILETGDSFEDQTHIVYVNGSYRADTALGWLVHDFFCVDPNKMHYAELAEKTRYFKEDEEGVETMKQELDDWEKRLAEVMRAEARAEGKAETEKKIILSMLQKRMLSIRQIAEVTNMKETDVEEIAKEAGISI